MSDAVLPPIPRKKRRAASAKQPLYSIRRDPSRPETEVAAFGHDREVAAFKSASYDRMSTEIFFVLKHRRAFWRFRDRISYGDYAVVSSYQGRPPPLVIDHEPIGASGSVPVLIEAPVRK